MTHHLPFTVFYEDTDMAGIVYYANYLKFIERGRSTLVAEAGIDQNLMREQGLVFAVAEVHAKYHLPAKYADQLTVQTEINHYSAARILFDQRVSRGEERLFSATVTVACLNEQGRISRIPAEIRAKLDHICGNPA